MSRGRTLVCTLASIAFLVLSLPGAGASTKAQSFRFFGPWTAVGSRVVFSAALGTGKRESLWTERFASNSPVRIGLGTCSPNLEGISQLALGSKSRVGCLSALDNGTQFDYELYVLLGNGVVKHVASKSGLTGEGERSIESIPFVFGDGSFLGYLYITPDDVVQLFRITASGRGEHVADLSGLSMPEAIAIDSGNIAISEAGTVYVYTTAGQQVATFVTGVVHGPGGSLEGVLAIRKDRIVVRTASRRFAVYTLRGNLVHSYPVSAANGITTGLASYYGYLVYLGAGKAVHALKLSSGKDRIVARAGNGFFWNGVSIQAPGITVPLSSAPPSIAVKLVFIPMSKIRTAVG